MARETERGLELGAPLTLEEAATLADVDLEEIEALVQDGTLLSERHRSGGRDATIVRLIDLGDVYPHVVGRSQTDGSEADVETTSSDLAATVRASDAERDSLIGLCQDLETRLDLAERERQASTASLLMAQRRVLDLEVRVRRRPWYADGAKIAAAAGIVVALFAIIALLRVPGSVDAAVAEEREAFALELERARAEARASLESALAEAREDRDRLEASLLALDEKRNEERRRERREVARAADRRATAQERARGEERSAERRERATFQSELREDLRAELEEARAREAELAGQVVEAVQALRDLEKERAAALAPKPPPPSRWYEALIRRARLKE